MMNNRLPMDEPKILTPQERRQRNREEMKETILRTGREIMREEGAGALNLHELARRVRLSTSSLYVYFSGKMAIYDALYALGVRAYREELERIIQTYPEPWEALRKVLENGMDLSLKYPELFQIVFERPIPGFVPSEESMAETDKMTTLMFMLLNRAMPAAEPPSDQNVPQAHGMFIAMSLGLISIQVANDPDLPVGSGRGGSLIPATIALFKSAWEMGAV